MLLVFKASSMKRACFWVFPPKQLCSDLIRQIKSLLSLNWQVLKILTVKFYFGSMPPFAHKPFLQSASKPLNAQCCTWGRSHRGRHYDCAYTVFTRFWCTPTQHITFNWSTTTTLLWGIDIRTRSSPKLSRI